MIVFIKEDKQIDHPWECRWLSFFPKIIASCLTILVHKLQETRFIAESSWLGHSEGRLWGSTVQKKYNVIHICNVQFSSRLKKVKAMEF